MDIYPLFFVVIGLFTITAAGFNWDWFMNHRKAQFFSNLLGSRDRGRFFYYVVGAGFVLLGLSGFLGLVDLS